MDLAAWAALLEASDLGNWMRGSSWAYPVVNLIHLLGLVLLLGPMLLLDLRLLGAGKVLALPAVSAALTPWAIAGLLLLVGSGSLLFAADAGPLFDNGLLRIKLLLIALGTANALAFRRRWSAGLADWDRNPPLAGRIQAALSLGLWLAAGTLGRLIAYG